MILSEISGIISVYCVQFTGDHNRLTKKNRPYFFKQFQMWFIQFCPIVIWVFVMFDALLLNKANDKSTMIAIIQDTFFGRRRQNFKQFLQLILKLRYLFKIHFTSQISPEFLN